MWFDLSAADSGKVADFYRQMFGWDVADAGIGGYRSWIGAGPQPWAGIVATKPDTTGQWLPYVVVDDLDRATKQAVSLGATVVRDASEGPAGTSVRIADPGGAQLALFKPYPAAS
jgi:predicted enzyme related to lactoylglutathione lyase